MTVWKRAERMENLPGCFGWFTEFMLLYERMGDVGDFAWRIIENSMGIFSFLFGSLSVSITMSEIKKKGQMEYDLDKQL